MRGLQGSSVVQWLAVLPLSKKVQGWTGPFQVLRFLQTTSKHAGQHGRPVAGAASKEFPHRDNKGDVKWMAFTEQVHFMCVIFRHQLIWSYELLLTSSPDPFTVHKDHTHTHTQESVPMTEALAQFWRESTDTAQRIDFLSLRFYFHDFILKKYLQYIYIYTLYSVYMHSKL